MTTWRTTVVGLIVILFAIARIWMKPGVMFEPETAALVGGGCSLILGTDRLLGFTK
jgi:hypothetical protein